MKFSVNLILFLLSAINCQDTEYFSSLVHLEALGKQESQWILKLEEIADEFSSDDEYVNKLSLHQYTF